MSNDPSYVPPVPSSAPLSAPPSRPPSIHLPLALLGLTFSIFLFTQIRSIGEQSKILSWQIKNAEEQDKNLKDNEKKMKELVTQREPMVKQSGDIQAKFQQILNDVLELAKEDKDAKEVVENWKIQRSTPAAGTEAPATAPK